MSKVVKLAALFFFLIVVIYSCKNSNSSEENISTETGSTSEPVLNDEAAGEAVEPYEASLCSTCEHKPGSINEMIEIINTFERPLKLETLVSSVMTGAKVIGSSNAFSGQPPGETHPRMIIQSAAGLILTVLPGADSLELSETTTTGYSKKAHIDFPLEVALNSEKAFEKVYDGTDGSSGTCGVTCHKARCDGSGNCEPYESNIIKVTSRYQIGASRIEALAEDCTDNGKICTMYRALMIKGSLSDFNFSVP